MGAVLSSLASVSAVEFSRLEVAECGVQADVVVLVDKLLHLALGGEEVVAVGVLGLVSHGAVPALVDAAELGVAGAGADVDWVVGRVAMVTARSPDPGKRRVLRLVLRPAAVWAAA